MHCLGYAALLFITLTGTDVIAQHVHPSATGTARESPKFSDFLTKYEKPAGPEAAGPYAAVPPELDKAVRALAMDDFQQAIKLLNEARRAAGDDTQSARVLMWLGLAYGSQAITYPGLGTESATSATKFLNDAIALDADVLEAPDVARVLGEMVGYGWTSDDPQTSLTQAEIKAEKTRDPLDFYYAGVISRRLAAKAWAHSDTTEQDKKTLSLFAKALARDPSRYESWSAYLPALLPVGMHDLATAEAMPMYEHFKNLRTPLLADQGPAVKMISNSSFRTNEQNEKLLAEVSQQWPDAPMPHFENAMRAIETTVPLALELFPKLISDLESGKLTPLPREAGYYPSALYKYAFLLQSVDRRDEALEYYEKVKAVSPHYAEVDLNLAILHAQKSDEITTGTQKLELLERALELAKNQERLDYRGKTGERTAEIIGKLNRAIAAVKEELAAP